MVVNTASGLRLTGKGSSWSTPATWDTCDASNADQQWKTAFVSGGSAGSGWGPYSAAADGWLQNAGDAANATLYEASVGTADRVWNIDSFRRVG